MNGADIEMGPVDHILVEWPDKQPTGEDGSVAIADLGEGFAVFAGASSGLLDDEDVGQAGAVLEPGTSAALLIHENAWAAPFATAVWYSGGELVASGRIPAADLLAALDAAEA